MNRRITVLLIDDHPVVQAGIEALLAQSELADLVGACGDADEALVLAERLKPDVILVDFVLQGSDGFDLAEKLIARSCESRMVLFTAHDHGQLLARTALSAGFCGYLSKVAVSQDLEHCLTTVGNGGYWLDGPAESVAL